MLSIDEAIAHAREKAKEIRENIIDGDNLEPYESYCNAMVAKSAEKHEQLADWLEELKELKSGTVIKNGEYPYFNGFKEGKEVGYSKAIDDFVEKIQWEYLNSCGIKQREIEFLIAVSSQVAEQLKAGRTDETI